jgi:uncharacterized membrane protein YedE/YeeE
LPAGRKEACVSPDWVRHLPAGPLLGGALIGLAVCMFALLEGRIAGISGIAGGLARPRRGDIGWRLAFILGLCAAPWLLCVADPRAGPAGSVHVASSWPMLLLAGVLVGFGTRLASGCTSGHGVCGVARASPRSIVATACFLAMGMATATLADLIVRGN